MGFDTVLVANRGEIAVRVLRAAADLGLRTIAVHTADEPRAPHARRADAVRPLPGSGAAGYLDGAAVRAIARDAGGAAVHPGYGFLSEDAGFAARCAEDGLTFVGPDPGVLALFGDKARARGLAGDLGIAVPEGTRGATDQEEAAAFLASLGPGGAVMVKACAGGGGRGIRAVRSADELADAYRDCAAEAAAAFGRADLYVERLVPRARHVEVQLVGDGTAVTHLWERDCTIQRRHQKLVEIAPAPRLPEPLREHLLDCAVRMGEAVGYSGLGTVEFLVDTDAVAAGADPAACAVFIEANPRLQVEHTVTEQITGVDLVAAQLRIARGATLADVGLSPRRRPEPDGCAVQVRVNLEAQAADGSPRPSTGALTAFTPPTGPGVRVDTHGHTGYRAGPGYDPLLAKVIVHARGGSVPPGPPDAHAAALARTERALGEFEVAGADTNIALLRAVVSHPDVREAAATTTFVADHLAGLRERARTLEAAAAEAAGTEGAGAEGRDTGPESGGLPVPEGHVAVRASMPATVAGIDVAEGAEVAAGARLLVVSAMKMEHVVTAARSGVVTEVRVAEGATVVEGEPLVVMLEKEVAAEARGARREIDPDAIRPDLAEVRARHAATLDGARSQAVAERHGTGRRTARENIDDLCDAGSFTEYGPLVLAAQRRRRSPEELAEKSPADGLVTGLGRVNGELFGPERTQVAAMAYDYTVMAGTQGHLNHRKMDRMLDLAGRRRLPVVLYAEGGGGRPGDTDTTTVSGLDVTTFQSLAGLSGLVPLVGIAAGRCFAGNAALLGCADVVIATADSTIGMGGPAMIEGGGLGSYAPEEVGPIGVQTANGVVDVAVADEVEATDVARRYLGYFQGDAAHWEAPDQRLLRHAVPENRLRAYDVRRVVETLADTGSVLELRRHFGAGVVTALVRIEGRTMGLVGNDPAHLGGAIDADAADKMARFLQLCDAFDLPVVSLCDTPGFMVGPEAERTATVRHFARLFVNGANLSVPICTVVLRKGYGLGAQAMAGGSFRAPMATVAWPTGEIGAMGLEGAVRLGARRELEAIADPEERRRRFEALVAAYYDSGKAHNAATVFELDDVIDPAETRRWITTTFASFAPPPRAAKKRTHIETW
ncbi:acetyl/propionyl-CoA carboxylase alpha subunit/acetyl-CoA carboxylase carboxyltransferase component [Spinactinospora alkalitolerans]|uniref:Acetyl/propionyl-CoA carboxylase alpha subunit/acetyl-CoA carboxylase carboxyltransferase component n=1 Tax=Spinactinospora alkalitolerans TaxID=687207 RepID=A0A852U028_9ACTN|nr:carboxyl transferase domain-containing protein [Spinactinospora alkalitolerans]NYE49538.1 acetyl/propionyl-CoA carboxylase alpha subunit/acetyl-CoA carboxylase carboxyltransferase component [Spinactinospora alkalitolerans]